MVYYNPYYTFLFLWSLVWTLEVKNDKGLPLYPGRAHYAKIDSFSKIFWDLQKNVFKRSDFRSEIQHSAPVHGRRPYIFHSSTFVFGQMRKCSFGLSLNGVHIVQKLSLSAKSFESRKKKRKKNCLQKEWFAIENHH